MFAITATGNIFHKTLQDAQKKEKKSDEFSSHIEG